MIQQPKNSGQARDSRDLTHIVKSDMHGDACDINFRMRRIRERNCGHNQCNISSRHVDKRNQAGEYLSKCE